MKKIIFLGKIKYQNIKRKGSFFTKEIKYL